MSTLEVQVREDGTVFVPADQVATLGAGPGERVAIELRGTSSSHKPSRGLLKGVLPSIGLEEFRAGRADRLAEFERRHA